MQTTKTQTRPGETKLETPRFENGRPLLIAGLRGHFTDATWAGIPAQWQLFVSFGLIPGQVGRVYYGLCFNLPNGIDYLCGAEVSNAAGLPADFTAVSIPAQKYAVFPYGEHVSKLRQTLEAINMWLPSSGHEPARAPGAPDFFERYGEAFDPKTGTGDIEVWIPIKS
jgi:AraC family transcriptional regulator